MILRLSRRGGLAELSAGLSSNRGAFNAIGVAIHGRCYTRAATALVALQPPSEAGVESHEHVRRRDTASFKRLGKRARANLTGELGHPPPPAAWQAARQRRTRRWLHVIRRRIHQAAEPLGVAIGHVLQVLKRARHIRGEPLSEVETVGGPHDRGARTCVRCVPSTRG
eukprot:CAMPEP_0176280642 /NCGR_PEP_ID=MMETSP0121_2-20121125/49892_1 /TAXON_ID=160619 /ORGANISM="Kryptoperidinium foliaceum, Strain CCMP 1326" /LENGTH=167 /DNA_ID=CAMNT_0017620967 /DNA_START=247 /DNA_END=748 /DNA_ORIENTATION=-